MLELLFQLNLLTVIRWWWLLNILWKRANSGCAWFFHFVWRPLLNIAFSISCSFGIPLYECLHQCNRALISTTSTSPRSFVQFGLHHGLFEAIFGLTSFLNNIPSANLRAAADLHFFTSRPVNYLGFMALLQYHSFSITPTNPRPRGGLTIKAICDLTSSFLNWI